MHETDDTISSSPRRLRLWLVGLLCLLAGMVLGRAFFPLERIVEKRVEVPVEKIVYRDRPAAAVAPAPQGWAGLQEGLNEEQVRALLGNPLKVMTSGYTAWEYPNFGHVMFYNGRLIRWSEPAR